MELLAVYDCWWLKFFPLSKFSRGSAIAKIVGANAKSLSNFEDRVTMYVYEEIIDGKKLTEIINETHENVKYLPGKKLPENVVSVGLFSSRFRIFIISLTINQSTHRCE